ncbi:hypothetical protein P7C71_g4873, partial [Lecanoromycetidae sp. Uapishka_2]
MQTNLREFISESEIEDNWLEASPADMEKIRELAQESLKEPTSNLADLMYKSVGIRDSRHGLQLNTSMWRLSFFGMNVDVFKNDPSIRWYFASSIPMMFIVLVLWYFIKHFLARQRQTPYSRGIYEHLFFELATAYPRLWSRSGPIEQLEPRNTLDRLKWRLIVFWNTSAKTVRAGMSDQDAEYDDLGAWSRFKRTLTRRWTSQIRLDHVSSPPSSTTLEEGGADQSTFGDEADIDLKPRIVRTSVTGDMPGGMLEVPTPLTTFMRTQNTTPRPSSSGSKSSGNRNSGVMVEEEPSTWLQDYGVKLNDATLY